MGFEVVAAIIAAVAAIGGTIISSVVDKNISDKNLEAQQDLLDYQKKTQEEVWNREDTAMQRTMEDYEKAGVNPLLALGNPYTSTGVVSGMSAPSSSYKSHFGNLSSSLSKLMTDTYKDKLDNIAKRKQNELLDKQIEGQSLANSERELALQVAQHNFDYYHKHGLPTNASGIPKQVVEGFSALENNFFKDGINEDSLKKVGEWMITPSRYSPLGIPIQTKHEVVTPSGDRYVVKDKRSLYDRARSWWIKRRSNAAHNYSKTFIE